MNEKKCKYCRFWNEYKCKRNPPIYQNSQTLEQQNICMAFGIPLMPSRAMFPSTNEDDWCGEFKEEDEK